MWMVESGSHATYLWLEACEIIDRRAIDITRID